jgi:hypothetical protein
MAEALGMASSVIAVVDLSAKVINSCVRYAQDVSHASEDKKRLAEEVTRLNLALMNARDLVLQSKINCCTIDLIYPTLPGVDLIFDKG